MTELEIAQFKLQFYEAESERLAGKLLSISSAKRGKKRRCMESRIAWEALMESKERRQDFLKQVEEMEQVETAMVP